MPAQPAADRAAVPPEVAADEPPEVFAQVPPKVIYTLTERGQSLRPVLRSLYDWSRTHPPQP